MNEIDVNYFRTSLAVGHFLVEENLILWVRVTDILFLFC